MTPLAAAVSAWEQRLDIAWIDGAMLEREHTQDAREKFLEGVAAAQEEEAHRLRVREALLAEREFAIQSLPTDELQASEDARARACATVAAAERKQRRASRHDRMGGATVYYSLADEEDANEDTRASACAAVAVTQAECQQRADRDRIVREVGARRRAEGALAEALAKLARAELDTARASGGSAAQAKEINTLRAEGAALRARLAESDAFADGLRTQCAAIAERLAASEVLAGSLRAQAAAREASYESKVAELSERRQRVEQESQELQRMQEDLMREVQEMEAGLQRKQAAETLDETLDAKVRAKPRAGGA